MHNNISSYAHTTRQMLSLVLILYLAWVSYTKCTHAHLWWWIPKSKFKWRHFQTNETTHWICKMSPGVKLRWDVRNTGLSYTFASMTSKGHAITFQVDYWNNGRAFHISISSHSCLSVSHCAIMSTVNNCWPYYWLCILQIASKSIRFIMVERVTKSLIRVNVCIQDALCSIGEITDRNTAQEKHVDVKLVSNDHGSSEGVAGDVSTFFHTSDQGKESWFAVDLGAERRRVTRVRIVNKSATTAKGKWTVVWKIGYLDNIYIGATW